MPAPRVSQVVHVATRIGIVGVVTALSWIVAADGVRGFAGPAFLGGAPQQQQPGGKTAQPLTLKVAQKAVTQKADQQAGVPREATHTSGNPPADPSKQAAHIEFFEKYVRPALAEHCYSCHGPQKQNAGLRLDTSAGIRAGGDNGPVIVPGQPEKSLLIRAVRRETDAPMPPKQALPPMVVAALVQWVQDGAALPPDKTDQATVDPRQHWAFQPIRAPTIPNPPDPQGRIRNDIDRFVLARLQPLGWTLAPSADRRTLIRRAYFDLIGLPPTAEEIEAFERDTDPQAWEKLIDRLLASPHFGERWARYWLDLARYADTKGYVFTEDRNYPFAYTYRDYVIRSFNEDKPYDRFLIEQIAADHLDLGDDKRPLAALGFLTLGRRFLNNIHDIIDDRIEVLCRTTMGLTVQCARCHDHKYDPISMADYYGLYGVFASCHEPKDLPLIEPVSRTPEVIAFENELANREKAYQAELARRHQAQLNQLQQRETLARYLQAVWECRQRDRQQIQTLARERDLKFYVLERWQQFLQAEQKRSDAVWPALWQVAGQLAEVPEKDFAPRVAQQIRQWQEQPAEAQKVPVVWREAVTQSPPQNPGEVWKLLARVCIEAAVATSPTPEQQSLRRWKEAGGPLDIPLSDFDKIQNRADREALARIRQQIDAYRASNPHAPPRAHVLLDNPQPTEPVIFLRGNPNNRGPQVPRQAPRLIAPQASPFRKGSGRLELAQAIAHPDNPLTARVMVNRVWMHLFGKGLVRTPSDFGLRSDPPTHPELLDYLAVQFIRDGWSIKRLIRRIMLSATYQQSSQTDPAVIQRDPDNLWLARQNRRRLDFEALRDGMLAATDRLDRTLCGRPVNILANPASNRRTIYAFMDRSDFATLFRAFDVASPDQHAPLRFETTVPQQALFLLNAPWVLHNAQAAARHYMVRLAPTPQDQVAALYRLVLARRPSSEELTLALDYLQQAPALPDFPPLAQLAQTLLISNEFAFVD